jgi:hypothetical protein
MDSNRLDLLKRAGCGVAASLIATPTLYAAHAPAEFVLDDVQDADFLRIKTRRGRDVPMFSLHNVENVRSYLSQGVPDSTLERATDKTL